MLNETSIIREQRKTIKITINREGNLTVFCPYGVSYKKIEQILQSKKNLLEKKINNTRNIANKYSKIMSMESILLFGKEYLIIPTNKVDKPCFTEEYFLIPKKNFDVQKLPNYIKKTIREIAERVVVKRFKDILQGYKIEDVSKIIIGSYRAKWGSCDKFGVIKLNWRVAMLDTKLVDFIIFHELTHLKELNHSQKFYKELSKICPDWKQSRAELKNYSFLLEMY